MTLSFEGRRVALIGGAGFIGHRLAQRLVELGAFVECVDSLQVNNLLHYISQPQLENRDLYLRILNSRLEALEAAGVRVDVQDARDYDALSRTLDRLRPDVVVQLAAVAHANRSNKDPFSTFDHSLRTLENALDVSRSIGVERFVYLSSSMVYGNFQTPTVDEEHPLDPIGIYGALKFSGERIVIAYNQVFDQGYTIVRPSALYGPGCVSKRVVQLFIEHALAGVPLRIDGDGGERLDFSYVDDVVEGICLAIASPRGANETFNITAGNARSINDLVAAVREHFPTVEVEYVERDALRPHRGTLSIDKARELVGYAPAVSLEEGVARYVEWYRDLVSDGRIVVGSQLA
ncbi:MAG: NAD-dependent epimerase/dehydratase family protein [Gaiellaceae bacterium]